MLISRQKISTEKWKLEKNQMFSDSALTCKELMSYHSHPENKKKAEKTESNFLGPIRKLRSHSKLLPENLGKEVNSESQPRSASEKLLEGCSS